MSYTTEYQLASRLRQVFLTIKVEENPNLHAFDLYESLLMECLSFTRYSARFSSFFEDKERCRICQDFYPDETNLKHHLPQCSDKLGSSIDSFESALFKVAKAFLLDLELVIPKSCYQAKKSLVEEESAAWREQVKYSREISDLNECLGDFESRLDRKFLAKIYNRTLWKNVLSSSVDISSVFVLLYELDKLLLYSKIDESGKDDSDGSEEDVEEIEEEGEGESSCRVCGSGSDPESILLCDVCDGEFHMDCLNPALSSIPAGSWVCPECRNNKRARR
jgi:hypothetical protein